MCCGTNFSTGGTLFRTPCSDTGTAVLSRPLSPQLNVEMQPDFLEVNEELHQMRGTGVATRLRSNRRRCARMSTNCQQQVQKCRHGRGFTLVLGLGCNRIIRKASGERPIA